MRARSIWAAGRHSRTATDEGAADADEPGVEVGGRVSGAAETGARELGGGTGEAGAGPHATSATALMTVAAIRPIEMIIGKVLGW